MNLMAVDDHPMVLEGLEKILGSEDEFDLIAMTQNTKDAMAVLKSRDVDLVLVDLRLGVENGFELIEMGKKLNANMKFAVLSSALERDYIQKAKSLDVMGYLLKDAFPEELIYAIKMMGKGRKYYDPKILEYAMKDGNKNQKLDEMTPRELEVLGLLAAGLSNKSIARTLFISECTVKKHVSQILQKLGVEDRTQAALYAYKNKFGKQ